MFKIRKNRSNALSEFVDSELYSEKTFYKAYSSDLKAATHSVVIESPFVTIRRSQEISDLLKKLNKRGVKVSIYTRNPAHHDYKLKDESIQGINILRQSGAKVVICNDMRHRKVSIIDGEILWEGSLNMLSQNGSKEVMRRTNSLVLCKQMSKFLGVRC